MIAGFLTASAVLVTVFASPSDTRIVDLKVPVEDGWQVNTDAPWKLEVSDERDMKVATQDFKPALPGYVLEAQTTSTRAQFLYKISGFFCTKDKSECKRQVFTGMIKVP